MNFQSSTMLVVFGSILAISIIALIILLIIRSKKIKESAVSDASTMVDPMMTTNPVVQPVTTPTTVAMAAGAVADMSPINNTMQYTSNPFENTNLDLNSQNLGTNLEATAGIPKEGIMNNPNTAPGMQIASTANTIPSMNPAGNTVGAYTDGASTVAQTPVYDNPGPVVEPVVPAQTIETSNTPVNSIPIANAPVTNSVEQMPSPVAPMNNTIPITQPTTTTASMQVNSVSSSGMDNSSQPVAPVNAMQDPAGIFNTPLSTQSTGNNATTAETNMPDDMEASISELPSLGQNTQPHPISEVTNTVADLTPEKDITQSTVSTTVNTLPAIELPDISAIDTAGIAAAAQPTPTAVPMTNTQPVSNTANQLPPLNSVPVPTPINNAVQQPVAVPAAMPATPVIQQTPAAVTQPVPTVAANIGMQPNIPAMNTQPVSSLTMPNPAGLSGISNVVNSPVPPFQPTA